MLGNIMSRSSFDNLTPAVHGRSLNDGNLFSLSIAWESQPSRTKCIEFLHLQTGVMSLGNLGLPAGGVGGGRGLVYLLSGSKVCTVYDSTTESVLLFPDCRTC